MLTKKFRVLPKYSFLFSALITLSCSIYSAYKGIVLHFVQKAMEDNLLEAKHQIFQLSYGLLLVE